MPDSTRRPRQAVILAGGQGVRLRPLTDTRPKPMIEFHGKPFLEYLIELVRMQGFEHVLLLLGYLPESIQHYFGDGHRWGVEIDYDVSAVENDTGRRLKLAESKIDPTFLLMYCDNYWPMPFDRMWKRYDTTNAQAMLTIYRNRDRYTRDNVRVDGDGWVSTYDKDRTLPDLAGVDIGFGLFKRDVLSWISPESNVSFERVVYPRLIAARHVQAFQTDHRYYSVSSLERLSVTEQFLARRPSVILDRDGVLNQKPPRAHYVRSWSDWAWLPGAREALRLFKETGFQIILVSNQAGIARGEMTETDLAQIHEHMLNDARQAGGDIHAIYYCPHGWDDGCACRKPQPGMLFSAQRDFHLDLSQTCFIGDDERDAQAAEAAGCPSRLVSERRTLLDVARELTMDVSETSISGSGNAR